MLGNCSVDVSGQLGLLKQVSSIKHAMEVLYIDVGGKVPTTEACPPFESLQNTLLKWADEQVVPLEKNPCTPEMPALLSPLA